MKSKAHKNNITQAD